MWPQRLWGAGDEDIRSESLPMLQCRTVEEDFLGEEESLGVGEPAEAGAHLVARRPFTLKLFRAMRSILVFLLPSFIVKMCNFLACLLKRKQRSSLSKVDRDLAPATNLSTDSKRLFPTAYLDGLRGVASLIVYVFHWLYLWFPQLWKGYGSSSGATLLLQLSPLRVLHSGRSSVTIFFVISGYVLTVKTLQNIYRGKKEQAIDSLAGGLFRRLFRLYLPICAATLFILVLVQLDLFQPDYTGWGAPKRLETLQSQLLDWWITTCEMIDPFRPVHGRLEIYSPAYDGHLWTIPVEFKGSLVVFVLLLASILVKRWIHLLVTSTIIVLLARAGDMDNALFCAGLVLAELSLLLPPEGGERPGPSNTTGDDALLFEEDMQELKEHRTTFLTRIPRVFFVICRHVAIMFILAVSLHFLSYPENDGHATPGFRTMSSWAPPAYKDEFLIQWFWNSIGSVLLIVALMYSPPLGRITSPSAGNLNQHRPTPLLQRIFMTSIAQYLGKISYSLYLAHGTVNHTIGVRYLSPARADWTAAEALGRQAGGEIGVAMIQEAWNRYVYKFAWATLVNTFFLFWVSDVFWRGVDAPMVVLTREIWHWAKRRA